MSLPTHEELLTQVDVRFRELAPGAPARLDPNDRSQAAMIQQWHQAHHEVLSKMTDEAFFAHFPNAPAQLDTNNSEHTTFVEYWKDIAAQIDGHPGRYHWSNAAATSAASATDADADAEEIEIPVQDGSVLLEDRVGYVRVMVDAYAEAVAATPLAAKLIDHTWKQVEVLRGLVKDGTFQTYDHWWRSQSFSEAIYDEDDRNEQVAFVRDLTLEAKIDRTTGALDVHLAGWASDLKTHNTFGRVSMANP